MLRAFSSLLVVVAALDAMPAFAQETAGPGKVEVTIIPGGRVFLTAPDRKTEPSFHNYLLGGAINVNLGPVGVEAEIAGGVGISQNLEFGPVVGKRKTPNLVSDSANLIVPVIGNRHTLVPYVTAGIGEVTLNRTSNVGQTDTETFFAGNVGGGVKWYSGRWGLRGDYRFLTVRSSDVAPGTFFGRRLRHGHRFYGAAILNLMREAPRGLRPFFAGGAGLLGGCSDYSDTLLAESDEVTGSQEFSREWAVC